MARNRLKAKAIVITHAHIDPIGGAHKLQQATGAPVFMNANDAALADMLEVQAALGTPAHEPGQHGEPSRA